VQVGFVFLLVLFAYVIFPMRGADVPTHSEPTIHARGRTCKWLLNRSHRVFHGERLNTRKPTGQLQQAVAHPRNPHDPSTSVILQVMVLPSRHMDVDRYSASEEIDAGVHWLTFTARLIFLKSRLIARAGFAAISRRPA